MSSYLSAKQINMLRLQVGVRSYSKCHYIGIDFIVLAKKHKLVLNCHLKNYVASLEDIFTFSYFHIKLFNNCRSHNKCCSPRPPVKIYVSLERLFFASLKTNVPNLFLYYPLNKVLQSTFDICGNRLTGRQLSYFRWSSFLNREINSYLLAHTENTFTNCMIYRIR